MKSSKRHKCKVRWWQKEGWWHCDKISPGRSWKIGGYGWHGGETWRSLKLSPSRCNECEEGGYYKVWSLITLTREAELWEIGTFSALPIWSRDSFLSILFVYIFCLRFVLFVSNPINQQVSPIAARHLVTIMTWPSVPIWKINASTNSYLGGRWSLSQNLHKTSIHKSSLSPESTKVLKK